MSPTCASPLCRALTMSVPVSTTRKLASTPCCLEEALLGADEHRQMAEIVGDHDIELGQVCHCLPPVTRCRRRSALFQHLRIDAIRRRAAVEQRLRYCRPRYSPSGRALPSPRCRDAASAPRSSSPCSAGGTFGSCSNTSSPAPAICFFFSARISAFSSMIAPRAVLMMKAVGFIRANCASRRSCAASRR